MSGVANCVARHFRWRSDTGDVNGTPTWLAAEDTNITLENSTTTTFRLRYGFDNNGTAPFTYAKLAYSKNGGSYTTIAAAGTTGLSFSAAASLTTDGTAVTTTNFLLTAMSGGKQGGFYDITGLFGGSPTCSSGSNVEVEFGFVLVTTADFTAGDTLDFRLYGGSTGVPLTSYDVTPRITIGSATTNNIMGQIVI